MYRGKLLSVTLHLFTPFIIGDTEGHDQWCGHYKSRTANIKQLCRYCECPTRKSYYSKSRDYCRRTPAQVNQLVCDGKLESLQLLLQQYWKKAFDDVRFGFHTNRGIFGACPAQMLHLVLIGWFKNVVESFFVQAGRASNGVKKDYNKLCVQISGDLRRHCHSDCELPRTVFSKGFSTAANMPGHEYTGCLLVMMISFQQTTLFREIFGDK